MRLNMTTRLTVTISLLMTDVVMPGMNGRDMANELLTRLPHLKRFFMSYTEALFPGCPGRTGAAGSGELAGRGAKLLKTGLPRNALAAGVD